MRTDDMPGLVAMRAAHRMSLRQSYRTLSDGSPAD